MADNRSRRGGQDGGRVAPIEGYNVRSFARRRQIRIDQAGMPIQEAGDHRSKRKAAAARPRA
jgi:hypothetical protein